jgi:hypothetical protein
MQGEVYLLHFNRPLKRASHYLGWAKDAKKRIALHKKGHSRVGIMNALKANGIGFRVAQVWEGTRNDERKLKNRKNASKFCPICAKKNEAKALKKRSKKAAQATRNDL